LSGDIESEHSSSGVIDNRTILKGARCFIKERTWSTDLAVLATLVAIALALRLTMFSGFVLGDDPAYAWYTSQILQGSGYPHFSKYSVFLARPLLLYMAALSIYLFGWQEWSFVLPILLSSLINTVLVYLIARELGGRRVGALSAIAYIFFPLDIVHSTTFTNDIPLSTFIWGGAFLLLIALNSRFCGKSLLAFVSGMIVGLGVAIKPNALAAGPLFAFGAFLTSVLRRRQMPQPYWLPSAAWSLGWAITNLALCLFVKIHSGSFWGQIETELRFNLDLDPSALKASGISIPDFLLLYPKWILGLAREGHPPYTFMPYGYFFIFFFACTLLAPWRQFAALRLPLIWAFSFFLILEFTPITLTPRYIPLHRLPRFLHLISIPAAICIGITFATVVQSRIATARALGIVAYSFLLASSIYWAHRKWAFYNDCLSDQRWAWQQIQYLSCEQIVTDPELAAFLHFKSGYTLANKINSPLSVPSQLPPGVLLITGGARRPDLEPAFAQRWRRPFQDLPPDWLHIATFERPMTPWRTTKMEIYRVLPQTVQQSRSARCLDR